MSLLCPRRSDLLGFVSALSRCLVNVHVDTHLTLQVASKFVGAFQCDQQCGNLTDEDLLAECSKQFCAQDEEEDAYADYYDEEGEQTV